MTIMAKKNSRGQLTGKWLVEVTAGGQRKRHTADTLAEARTVEAAFKAQQPCAIARGDPVAAPSVYTVGRLQDEARVVWRDTKDERQSIARFEACCCVFGLHTDLRAIRTRQLDKLVTTLRARGLTDSTVHRYLCTFSAALRWAHAREIIDGMPSVPWPEVGKPREHVVTVEKQEAFLDYLSAHDPQVYLIYRVLFTTGMRIGELMSIKPENIDALAGSVKLVDTKNGDDRTVPLSAELIEVLQHQLANGGLPNYTRINRVSKRAGKAAGMPFTMTPHVARHTVVTRLEAAGVGLKTIGQLVGHRSITTTSRYAHPSQASLKAATKVLS